MTTSLVNGLGGSAGFGESAMIREDDEPSVHIDLSSVMPGGLNFFGTTYTSLYLNYNGSITFGTPLEQYTPTAITALTNIPIIAPYWADVDTRSGVTSASPGGTSTGSNLVWYDLDAAGHSFTATWDDVGYFSQNLDKVNAFQLRLVAVGTNGDFDIQFRYESITWTTGDASGGDGGLFGQVAVAGYSSGDGEIFFQMPQSGNQAAMLALPSDSNIATPGLFTFSVRQGVPVVAQFSIAAASADQPEGNSGTTDFTFTVSLTGDSSVARTVSFAVTGVGDHAASASDFVGATFPSGTLTFAAHQTERTITLQVQGDAAVEVDETFRVALSNATGGATLGTDKSTGTIRNDDVTRLAIAATNADLAEGDSGATDFTFTVTRTGDTSVEHTVAYSVAGVGGHPAAATDFAAGALPTGLLTFAANQSVQTIALHVSGDTAVEHDEGFIVTLANASDGAVIEIATAAGTIRNDDRSTVSIAALSADKAEGNSGTTLFTFTITLDQANPTVQSVDWSVVGSGGHAANAADFGGAAPFGTAIFAANETTKTVEIAVSGDTAVEFDESFTVTLANASAGLAPGVTTASGSILNDDAAVVSIAALPPSKAEGDAGFTVFTFMVTLGQASVSGQTVEWTVAGSGPHAASADDFADAQLSGTVTFLAGETSKALTVLVAGDTTVELDEGFTVTLSNASAGLALGTTTASETILNDDQSTVSISAAFAERPEGDSGTTSYEIPIVLDQAAVTTQTVSWAVAGIGSHPADAADFNGVLPFGILTFAPGETGKTVIVTLSGDTVVEPDEGAVLVLSNPSAGLQLGIAEAVGTILNDDKSTVSIAALSASKPEGNGGTTLYTFALTLDQAGVAGQSIDWNVAGTGPHAADGADFGDAPTAGSISFAPGETSKILSIAIRGDTTVELDEGFAVTLSNPSSGLSLGVGTAGGIIQNDDSATVSIAPVLAALAEGNSGATSFDFKITLSQAATGGETVAWSLSGTGAHPADAADLAAPPGGLVTFVAGQTSAMVGVLVAGDSTVEFDESISVALSSPSPGLTLGISSAVATILNDDRPVVSITAATALRAEGDAGATAFTFTVSLDQVATVGQSIDWAVSGSEAHAADASDFGGTLPTGRVTFVAGETSKIVTVLVSGDGIVEHDEGFEVGLFNASAGLAVGTASASGTILNDDKSVVSISAAAAVKTEGHAGTTPFTFTVSLAQAATTGQSVDWKVVGSGAHAADAADFGGTLPTGSMSFAAGETSKTLTILVAGDSAVELDESFKVALSNESPGLTLGDAVASGAILNDDATVAIAALAASKAEGDADTTTFTFEVILAGDSSVPHSVSYTVSGAPEHPADATDFAGGALPGGTLSFGVGETSRTIAVAVAGDTEFEADEKFVLGLSAPSAGLTIAIGSANGTILNDDAAGPPQPTIVHDDAYVGLSGQTVQMSAANGVLFNDSGTKLASSLISGPAHGTLAITADGSFDYTSAAGFAGTDSFRYLALGAAGGEVHTVDVHIARLTPSATLDLLSLSAEQQVAIAYTTFFGRGADAKGFAFWVDEFNAGLPRLGPAGLFSAIADAFAGSAEARALYPLLDHARGATDAEIGGFLNAVYNNLFDRSTDAAGLAYWTGQVRQVIAAGQFVGSVLDDIVGGARNSEAGQDIATVLGKAAVSLSYVHDQQRYHAPWTAVDDAVAATALLHGVTSDPRTVLIGVVQAYDLVIASLARADGFGEVPSAAF